MQTAKSTSKISAPLPILTPIPLAVMKTEKLLFLRLHHMVFAMWKSQEMAVSFPISAV